MGNRTLTMAKQEGKGWFALLLAEYLTPQVQIPAYIMQAIHFAHGEFPLPFLSEFSSIAPNTDTVPMY
jgi:putative ATP-dependent endonuclease of OLD family